MSARSGNAIFFRRAEKFYNKALLSDNLADMQSFAIDALLYCEEALNIASKDDYYIASNLKILIAQLITRIAGNEILL